MNGIETGVIGMHMLEMDWYALKGRAHRHAAGAEGYLMNAPQS